MSEQADPYNPLRWEHVVPPDGVRLHPSHAAAERAPWSRFSGDKPGEHRRRLDRAGSELAALGTPTAVRLMEALSAGPLTAKQVAALTEGPDGVYPEAVVALRLAGLAGAGYPVGFTRRGREVWMSIRGLV